MRRLTRRPTRPALAAALATLLPGVFVSCTKARPDAAAGARCVSWKDEIGPLLGQRCQPCHAGETPAAGYRIDSYLDAVRGPGRGGAGPVAAAGDDGSRLLAVLDPATADAAHQPVSDVFDEVRGWVVDCKLSYVRSSTHRGGILDPTSADFHGRLVRDEKYDFSVCQRCHGADFAGGGNAPGPSCLGCHAEGPTACSTCHGDIAASGSHGHHLGGGPLGKSYDCATCHVVPAAYTDAGHIFQQSGALDPPPAEVRLGALAAFTPAGATRPAPPAFDPATQACSNVYCHGALYADDAATGTTPRWNAPGTGQADCGSCHGLPPRHAGSAACGSCHPAVADTAQKIIAPARHIDGAVDLGDPAAGCAGCHGGPDGPAPPRDLTGGTAPSSPGVGAHQAHLAGGAHLRGPIACNECHRVPADVTSAGHFAAHDPAADPTAGAEVFPADSMGPTGGALAFAGGAQPRWDRATATCAGVYCHGGGTKLAADASAGVDHAPMWTSSGGLPCGASCHGLPPSFSPHLPAMTRTDCASCHPRTVTPAGEIILAGPPGAETSAHMNGALDVAP